MSNYSRRGGETSSSDATPSSSVQIAFDSNPTPQHCGYCDTNGSCSAGVVASMMLVDDYQILMDRGWRKCGTYFYKSLMDKTCCPLYTIRCDANNVKLSSSQRRVIQTMNRFINDDIKPDDHNKSIATSSPTTNSTLSQSTRKRRNKSTKIPPESTISSTSKNPIQLEQWMKTESTTNAMQLLHHILTNDTPPTDELLHRLRSRQKRWQKKLLKLKSNNLLSPQTDIHLLIKRFDRMNFHSHQCSLEQMLQFNETQKNQFELRLIRSYPPSEEFKSTLKISHEIYQRYQMAIHGDSISACSLSQFERFLGHSSLQQHSPRLSSQQYPSCGYGSFHLQYYLNSKMIACSVIDILPGGISSVYFYYEPSLGFLKLGVYSALREIELTRRLAREIPDIKYYYLGFYVHSCVKMRYKGQYKPSFLLCPETFTWHPIEKCHGLLDAHKYARLESNPAKVDENEEQNVEQLKLRINRLIISPLQLQQLNESYFFYILDSFRIFVKFVGRICANRIIIDLH